MRTLQSVSICFRDWWPPTIGPDLQRPCLTFAYAILNLSWAHKSPFFPANDHLLNYRWEVHICGQKPGPGLIKQVPSFQRQSTTRNPTTNFPRTTGSWAMPVLPSMTFSQVHEWLLTESNKTPASTAGFEWDDRETRINYQGDLQKLLPICLPSSVSKTISKAV